MEPLEKWLRDAFPNLSRILLDPFLPQHPLVKKVKFAAEHPGHKECLKEFKKLVRSFETSPASKVDAKAFVLVIIFQRE